MKKAALAAAGVFLALLLTEVFLRVSGLGLLKPTVHLDQRGRYLIETGLHVLDPHLFWRRPDGPLTAAEQQMRLVTVGEPAPPRTGRFRIICLGDSCTRLSRSQTPYSVLLERELGPDRVEVFNASLPGYTSYQGLVWLQRQLLDWQPDLVVVYFGWNDHWRATGFTDEAYAARLRRWRPRLLNLLTGRREPPPLRVPPGDYRENLRRIAELVGDRGGRTVVVLAPCRLTEQNIPMLLQVGNISPGDDPRALHGRYLAEARRLVDLPAVRVLDAAGIFAAIAEPELLLMRDGIHPSDQGHAVLAAGLARLVRQWCLAGQPPGRPHQ